MDTAKRLILFLVVGVLNQAVGQEPVADGLPDPKIVFDDSNYPNIAFSKEEAARRDVDFAAKYVWEYILQYSASRKIPVGTLSLIDVVTNAGLRDKLGDKNAPSLEKYLKDKLDFRVSRFEASGGLLVFRYLMREADKLETEIGQSAKKQTQSSVDTLADRTHNLEIAFSNLGSSRQAALESAIRSKIVATKGKAESMKFWLWGLWFIAFLMANLAVQLRIRLPKK